MSILATLGPALISGAVGLHKQRQQRKAQERAMQEQEFAHRQGMVQDRLSQNPIPNYTPTFQKGGNLPNYDYKRAKELGYGPDSTGHWPSRDTETGRILKAPHHPTFQKTIAQDRAAGYTPMMDERGNVYTMSPQDLPRSGKFAPSRRNLPQKQMGGQVAPPQDQAQFIDHQEGQTHEGPDGGIPVDERGQPAASSGAPEVALTEKGEVTFDGYVYSDDLKLPGNKKRTFADEAKRLKNKHKLHLGEDLEKTDKIAYNALVRELKELRDIQEAKKGEMVSKEEAEMMAQEAAQMGSEQQMAQQGEVPMEGGQPPMDPGMMQQEQGLPMMQQGGNLPVKQGGGSLWDAWNDLGTRFPGGYQLGAKGLGNWVDSNTQTGKDSLDCSGAVCQIHGDTMGWDPLNVGSRNIRDQFDKTIDPSEATSGDFIYIEPKEEEGSAPHIAQIVKNPETGELYIAESTSSQGPEGETGVRITPYNQRIEELSGQGRVDYGRIDNISDQWTTPSRTTGAPQERQWRGHPARGRAPLTPEQRRKIWEDYMPRGSESVDPTPSTTPEATQTPSGSTQASASSPSESRWLPESEVTADRGDIYRRGVRNRSLKTSTPSINFEQKDLSGHPRIGDELPLGEGRWGYVTTQPKIGDELSLGEGKWGHVNRSPRIGDELPIGDGRWGHVNSTQDTQGGEWREAQAQIPWANMAASLIPGLVGLARHKPTERLNLPRTRMPRANLEQVRAGARQQGRTALATGRRAGARTGATGAQMLSGTGTTAANVARGVGDAYRDATLQEQQMNMQAIGQERQMNMQAAQQERMANWQARQRDRQREEGIIASMARVPQQGMADYQKQRDTLAALNTQGPMQVQEYYDPNQSRLDRMFRGRRTRVGTNPLYNPELHS